MGSAQGIKIVDNSGRGSGGGQEGSVVKIKNVNKLSHPLKGEGKKKLRKRMEG